MVAFLLILLVLLLVAFGIAIGFVILLKSRLDRLSENQSEELRLLKESAGTELERLQAQYRQLHAKAKSIADENAKLAAWKKVGDADEQAQELIARANAQVKQAEIDIARLRTEANHQAAAIVQRATEEGASSIASAMQQLDTIIKQKIGATDEVARLTRAVTAIRNSIDGYGDQYIMPAHSLLDDLAEEYGHAEAGKELKAIRAKIRAMIKGGDAAACDYVEENRRKTAINFVVDAFDGKVDSILARVKHDNAGTLSQEVKDAFELVNLNGEAFRNARITETFLLLRLSELRWAAAIHYLRQKEREEQRVIKEQIRDEERARREFEREIKKTEKEEAVLRKAMEAARKELEAANVEERARLEQQLADLAQKLKDAEERGRRAISMAQQTKQGHVYIISNIGSFGENVYKIGLTRRLDPLERIWELGDSSVPFGFDVHALIFAVDAPSLERQLHQHFVLKQINKVNHRKEFFRVTISDLKSELESLNLIAKWTDTAVAAEYRETLAIEREFQRNPKSIEDWRNRQLELDPVGFSEEMAIVAGQNGAEVDE